MDLNQNSTSFPAPSEIMTSIDTDIEALFQTLGQPTPGSDYNYDISSIFAVQETANDPLLFSSQDVVNDDQTSSQQSVSWPTTSETPSSTPTQASTVRGSPSTPWSFSSSSIGSPTMETSPRRESSSTVDDVLNDMSPAYSPSSSHYDGSRSRDGCYNDPFITHGQPFNHISPTVQQKPSGTYLIISVQPQYNGYRFRYVTEGLAHGSIAGTGGKNNSCPVLSVIGLARPSGKLRYRVELVKADSDEPHPNTLNSKENSLDARLGIVQRDVSYEIKPQNRGEGRLDIEIRKVAINMVKRAEVKDRMLELDSFKYCEENGKSTHLQPNESFAEKIPAEALETFSKKFSKKGRKLGDFDMSKVRLKFTVWLLNDGRPVPLSPVISSVINNEHCVKACALKIFRLSDTSGSCKGGKEIIILCSQVQKEDISVVFREMDDSKNVIWEKEAEIMNVHHQYAIVFKTPPFKNGVLENCHTKSVDVVLCRKNSDLESDRYPFIYNNYTDDKDYIENKRKKARTRCTTENAGMTSANNVATATPIQQSFQQVPQQNVHLPTSVATPGSYVLLQYPNMQMPVFVQNPQPQMVFNPNQPINVSPMPQGIAGQPIGLVSQPGTHPQPETTMYAPMSNMSTINVDDLQCVGTDSAPTRAKYSVKIEDDVKPYMAHFNNDLYGGNGNFSTKIVKEEYEHNLDERWRSEGPEKGRGRGKVTSICSQFGDMKLNDGFTVKAAVPKMRNVSPDVKNEDQNLKEEKKPIFSRQQPHWTVSMSNKVETYASTGNASSLLQGQREDLFSIDDQGDNTLHLAVIHEQQKSLESLLHAMSKYNKQMFEALNARNSLGQTPLHIAAYTNQPRAMLALLKAKADFRKADRHGNTVIHIACLLPLTEGVKVLKLLADFVYDKKQVLLTQYLAAVSNIRNFEGKTSLHMAVENADLTIIDILERIGVDPDKGDRNSGRTPLHYAVQMKKTAMVRHLLYKTHASPNVEAFDNSTPLHIAVEAQDLEVIEMLVDKGADPTIERSLPDPEAQGPSCFDMAECNDEIHEILSGNCPTLYKDLISSLDMYDRGHKVLYLGIGGQETLVNFLTSKMSDLDYVSSEKWAKFLSTLGLDRDICQKDKQNLFLSVLLHGGIRIGTLRNALMLLHE